VMLRVRLRALSLTVAGIAGLALALGATGQAQAAPSPGEVEAMIDQQWNQLEPLIEQYNKIDSELAANTTKVKQLTEQIKPLQMRVDMAMSRISALAVQYYKSGRPSPFVAMLTTGSPTTFADRLTLLNGIALTEQLELKDVITLKSQYDEQKKPLDELVAKLAAQKNDLATRKAAIDAEIKRLNDLRLSAYGSGVGTGSLKPVQCPVTYSGGPGAKAAQTACNQIGKSYVFNTSGPRTFDCSGLTMYAWSAAGVSLRHYTKWQYEDTKRVTRSQLQPGDLVFFYSDMHHMGIYVGSGWMVHAPHSGDVVRMKKIDSEPISGYGRPG
jgi:peptidoglycan DL-endopeptidase CwlO